MNLMNETRNGCNMPNLNRYGARCLGLMSMLGLLSVGCGPQEAPRGDDSGAQAQVMVRYHGGDVAMDQLFSTRTVSCDDHLGHGIISCYDSAEEMVANRRSAATVATQYCDVYVTLFEHHSYGGSSISLSGDYNWLGLIGWDNMVSSVRVPTGCAATFFEGANYDPGSLPSSVTYSDNAKYVTDSYNDRFSAVRQGTW